MTEDTPAERWEPANDVEHRLVAALRDDDRTGFFGILLDAPLYLAQTVAPDADGSPADPADYVTYTTGDVTYLLAFTSLPTLQACVGHIANGYVESDFATVRAGLDGSDVQVGFNLGTPVDAWIDAESVVKAAAGELTVPTAAELTTDVRLDTVVDGYVAELVRGEVYVTAGHDGRWLAAPVDGVPTIVAYSSADTVPPGTVTVTVAFLALVTGWPADAGQLSMDPGTPVAFTLPADALRVFTAAPGPDGR